MNVDSRDGLGYTVSRWYIIAPPNGTILLRRLYPRKNGTTSSPKKRNVDPVVRELAETLESMGLETTVEQVKQGLTEIYPDGTADIEQGLVIRELFRYLKSQV